MSTHASQAGSGHQTVSSSGEVDYDLHGIVGIRLVGAAPGDAAAVDGQLGPIRRPLEREPDIVVRFVERLELGSPIRYAGLEAAFTDDEFLILRSRHQTRARAQVAFDRFGERCEIVCETGSPGVPLLIPLLNITALAKGVVPLHAAAFTYNGTGVLVTGWAKGGKTEALIAFTAKGAQFIGDEWIYVGADSRLYGLPQPIRLWDWHLPDLPEYRALLTRRDRARLRALGGFQMTGEAVQGALRGGPAGKLMTRLLPVLERQRYAAVEPERLFGPGSCVLSGRLDKLVFVVSHESPEVTVEKIDPQEVAARMAFSLKYERLNLLSTYLTYRFSFPQAPDGWLEQAQDVEQRLLSQALAGKPAYAVHHPFPAPIPGLFDAIEPILG
jgi:hypothetical protein